MNSFAQSLINVIEKLDENSLYAQADSLNDVLLKFARKKMTAAELSNFLERKKMNIKCSELESILKNYGFEIEYDKKRHIKISHPMVNWFVVTSCHQHNIKDQYNPSEIHRLKHMIYQVSETAPEFFASEEKIENTIQDLLSKEKARAIAEGDWRFFEDIKKRN